MPLRPYQLEVKARTLQAWQSGTRNVLDVMPTGAGKTKLKASIVEELNEPACCIAHRRELVEQISLALAHEGVRHRIIAPDKTIKQIARAQVDTVGRSLIYPTAPVAVAGVDSLGKPNHALDLWGKRCGLWVVDEAHHLLLDNKWGRALDRFPNARGLGVTATPVRADGKGLGRHAHGVFDEMIVGPSMRDLIRQGYLTDYRIVGFQAHLQGLQVGASGEYTGQSVDSAIKESKLIGKIVPTWLKHARGLRTVVFAHSIEAAREITDEFIVAGIRAASVSSKTDDDLRRGLLRKFGRGELDVLVNVDLFGEGFDLPAIECVVFARPTASYGLYVQQFGRVLRLLLDKHLRDRWDSFSVAERLAHIRASTKPAGLIIDHVGNVTRHGLPDAPRNHTLDARERRSRESPGDVMPVRTCGNLECLAVYEQFHKECPYCGWVFVPSARTGPEQVDGDPFELDPATLAKLRGESDRYYLTPTEAMAEMRDKRAPHIAVLAAGNRHTEWQAAQSVLRGVVEQWCGYRRAEGYDDATICRIFYLTFRTDIMTAYGLRGSKEINTLAACVAAAINR